MKTSNETAQWMDCGNGALKMPSGADIITDVVEQKGFGRIFEVYHYGNDPDGTQRMILAAPDLLAALENVVDDLEGDLEAAQVDSNPEITAMIEARLEAARAAISRARGESGVQS